MQKRKPPLGSGKRFSQLATTLGSEKGVRNPKALAAYIGRRKYKRKFQQLSEKGRRA